MTINNLIDPIMLDFLTELPKCEHHCHLEGTLSPSLLFKLAKKNSVKLPDEFPDTPEKLLLKYDNFENLDDFLKYYYVGMNVLITEDDFFELAWNYLLTAKSQGVYHLELFFDPQGHLIRSIKISFDTIINGLTRAFLKAKNELEISTKLTMCILRHLPLDSCFETINLSKKYYENGQIHGLGLDSSEKPFPPTLFKECYSEISKTFPNVGLTAHAGEEGGPDFVVDSINELKVTRIDHGVNSIKDLNLIDYLSKNQILLTVCPISNLKLQVIKNLDQLPLNEFLKYNVPFSINSDDPAYFNSYILDNYAQIQKAFNWNIETWCKIANNSINGSWIADKEKELLLLKVDQVYHKYKSIMSDL
ncbi:adenosine deaminase [Ascoidea rubescens DSM 1968]|uniref:Adenine deaminase n=1 Tax=Ascoidea rubescens DSM 1968 TaxID=1344418 RepID=A0A1D2VR40_9ASCO|nr:adenosine deaminase [Ascoidea rubescens DSM 1968]ODV64076.1 adenosine deaminase [Ascoidea rubescens DSM 1968]